jgi:hypothetical protein
MDAKEKEALFKIWETKFYDKENDSEIINELDIESLAIGFFIAIGCSLEVAVDMYQYCIEKGKY